MYYIGLDAHKKPSDWLQSGNRQRIGSDDRTRDRDLAVAGGGPLPGDHLIEHQTERENVTLRARFLALNLLWGHILQSPQQYAIVRQ
jgi:hypothetical protein